MKQVAERYRGCRTLISTQVIRLQADATFRELASMYYGRGFKDWVLLVAIANCMANWKIEQHGVDLLVPDGPPKLRAELHGLDDTSYPPWRFDEQTMESHVGTFHLVCLRTYGFEPRRQSYDMDAVEAFLRCRMRHFELDYPHAPLFGEVPGTWPDL